VILLFGSGTRSAALRAGSEAAPFQNHVMKQLLGYEQFFG
jgi:hypothetical protein